MKTTLKFVTVLLATTMFVTAAQAAEKEPSTDFADRLVKAALPKDASLEGIVNSGSLGVTLFLLCEIGRNAGSGPTDDGACPK